MLYWRMLKILGAYIHLYDGLLRAKIPAGTFKAKVKCWGRYTALIVVIGTCPDCNTRWTEGLLNTV